MSVIGPRPGLWNQDILTAERDKYNANDVKPGLTGWMYVPQYVEKPLNLHIFSNVKEMLLLFLPTIASVAIIVLRKGADENALAAAKGCLRESGKLILCLSDEDLKELLRIKEKDEQPTAEFFEAMLDDLLIHLEK